MHLSRRRALVLPFSLFPGHERVPRTCRFESEEKASRPGMTGRQWTVHSYAPTNLPSRGCGGRFTTFAIVVVHRFANASTFVLPSLKAFLWPLRVYYV
ncbi:hypothetical protein AVEN_8286-1 [Araneus ventricosus]|uniref:Uncharacterized protein n=1 Tax=Araneus ventricosus TaxID=182803 RepID=A0A4Y2FCN3_ARAVE|nr:hypothetical protein AVEN_8286-1 [Araneus ventricosus]